MNGESGPKAASEINASQRDRVDSTPATLSPHQRSRLALGAVRRTLQIVDALHGAERGVMPDRLALSAALDEIAATVRRLQEEIDL